MDKVDGALAGKKDGDGGGEEGKKGEHQAEEDRVDFFFLMDIPS